MRSDRSSPSEFEGGEVKEPFRLEGSRPAVEIGFLRARVDEAGWWRPKSLAGFFSGLRSENPPRRTPAANGPLQEHPQLAIKLAALGGSVTLPCANE